MKIKDSLGERIFDVFNVLFMLVMLLIILIPLLNIFFSSLSDPMLVMKHKGMVLYPLGGIDISSYKAVARNPNILSGYMNTLFIVIVGTSLNLLLTVVAAYVLSRKNVMWNTTMTLFIVFTMYFSGGMIPFYLTVRAVGLDGSLWALIIPSAVSTYNLIIMRTAMSVIPSSMEESAKIDGATHTRILFSIMVPLAKATLAVITLNYAVSHWNAWFNAMIFLRDKTKFPLQLILKEILVQNDTSMMTAGSGEDLAMIGETIKYATIVVVTIPILCVYPFLQRYFVKGVMIGAVKG
jgi:putative aldouronate transport system permease protein